MPWVLAVMVVGSVVAFDPFGWAVFGPIKWTVVTAAIWAAVALAARNGLAVHRWSALGWAAFLVWGVIVSLGAVDPLATWLGTPDRRLGLLAWATFAAAFMAGQAVTDLGVVRMLARAVTLGGLAIGVYGLLEVVGLQPVDLMPASGRVGGPYGSAAYLGASLTLLLPITVALAVDRGESTRWRVLAAIALALELFAAAMSATRAAWFGLVVAAAVSFPAWRRWLRRHLWIGVTAASLLVPLVALTPIGERLRGDVGGRVAEWRIGLSALGNHPLLGTGFEGYRIVFPQIADAEYSRSYGRAVITDRVHNGPLDVGVTTGVLGLAAYLSATVWLVSRTRRGVRSSGVVLAGIGAAVTGFLAQQVFLFPTIEVDAVFWVFAGVLVAATNPPGTTVTIRFGVAGVVVAGGIALAALLAGALDVAADHETASALSSSDRAGALAAADRAARLRPDSFRYPLVGATVVPRTLAGLDLGLERIEAALELSPRDPALLTTEAELLLDRARLSHDASALAEATQAWQALVTDDPNHPGHRLQLGVALALGGDASGAERAWLAAEYLAPNSAAAPLNLARLYLELGKRTDSEAALARARRADPSAAGITELEGLLER